MGTTDANPSWSDFLFFLFAVRLGPRTDWFWSVYPWTRRKNRLPGSLYGNFDPGDQDKLMITYKRELTHDYTMFGACSVVYQGYIHFFGGTPVNYTDFGKQHFVIETKRSGKMVKMTKMKDLDVSFQAPSCSNFQITSNYFPWSSKNIVILCFKYYQPRSCFS